VLGWQWRERERRALLRAAEPRLPSVDVRLERAEEAVDDCIGRPYSVAAAPPLGYGGVMPRRPEPTPILSLGQLLLPR
jgi:hypothetical protein